MMHLLFQVALFGLGLCAAAVLLAMVDVLRNG
jgi:hypothetical protein